jgi:hypothetical protein
MSSPTRQDCQLRTLTYQQANMQFDGASYAAVIPAEYTESPYTLQYFFVLPGGPAEASIYPGLGPRLSDQPYFVVRQA